jgi:tyrosyl-tRNA synthetase
MAKLETITSNAEEIVTLDELKMVLNKTKPKGYIGFEPSGTVHLGWKICTNKIKDFLDCGSSFVVNIWRIVLQQWDLILIKSNLFMQVIM